MTSSATRRANTDSPGSIWGEAASERKRSPLVADHLFTGSSQRRVHTQNLQADIRLEQYATSIERAKRSTEHEHNFRKKNLQADIRLEQYATSIECVKRSTEHEHNFHKKAFIQKSECLQIAKHRLQREAALLEEQLRQEVEVLIEVAPEDLLLYLENNRELIDEGPDSTRMMSSRAGLKGTSSEGAAQIHRRASLMPRRESRLSLLTGSEAALEGNHPASVATWSANFDTDLDVDTSVVHGLRKKKRNLTNGPGQGETLSSSEAMSMASFRKRASRSNSIVSCASIMSLRKLSDIELENNISTALSRRTSVASLASSGGEMLRKQSFAAGDVHDIIGGGSKQLDVGNLRMLSDRFSNKKVDRSMDCDVAEYLEEAEAKDSPQKSQLGKMSMSWETDKHLSLKAAGFTEFGEKQLMNKQGTMVMNDIPVDRQTAAVNPDVWKTGAMEADGLLQQLRKIPITLPAIHLTHTRSSMMRPRNFEKEAIELKSAMPVNMQFDNLRYCRYLRMPSGFDRFGAAEEEDVKPKRTPRIHRTVIARPREVHTNPSVISLRQLRLANGEMLEGDDDDEDWDMDGALRERLAMSQTIVTRMSMQRAFAPKRPLRLLAPFSLSKPTSEEA